MIASSEKVPLHPIGRLYAAWALNFMVDIAHAISLDFVDRPGQYQRVPAEVCDIMAGFRSFSGSHPDWPDAQQRLSLFRALGIASIAGAPLREAALVFVEDGKEFNRDLLTDAFRDAAGSFRSQLRTMEGEALQISSRQIDTIFRNAMQVFQSDEVMSGFGLTPAPKDESWPLGGPHKGDGTHLAAELIRAIDAGVAVRSLLGGPKRETPGAPAPKPMRISMSQNKFILLQQAASYGASAMSAAMTEHDLQNDPIELIGNAYKWAKALQKLIPDVVRVWKDPNYRARLTDLEWGMVAPHPSEAVSLAVAGSPAIRFGGFSTATVRGEVCCSTGDLICASSSNCEEKTSSGFCNCTWGAFSALCEEP